MKRTRCRRKMSDEEVNVTLFSLLLESIVMDNDQNALSLLYRWQSKELVDEAVAMARAITPCRLLMAGGPS